MFLLIAFVKIIDGYIYNKEIQALIEFLFLPVCLFKLEIILVEGGKKLPRCCMLAAYRINFLLSCFFPNGFTNEINWIQFH